MRTAILAALLGAALLAGCGGDDDTAGQDTTKAAAPTDTIRIKGFNYDPVSASVKVDQKISVPNADSSPHTLTQEGGSRSFDSGTIEPKQSGSVTFSKTGKFKYFCELHPTMKGTVIVTQ
ncbi:MAG: cupredoxin domain-containing protein [Solirubrobacteraceae bacterium]